MPVTVKRYGGWPLKPEVRTFDMKDLDVATREALGHLLGNPQPPGADARMPDAFTYSFEVDGEGGTKKKAVEVVGPRVPDALRKLLP
jgi:hypothetical protein